MEPLELSKSLLLPKLHFKIIWTSGRTKKTIIRQGVFVIFQISKTRHDTDHPGCNAVQQLSTQARPLSPQTLLN